MGDLVQIIDTVFINPVIHIYDVFFCRCRFLSCKVMNTKDKGAYLGPHGV